MPPLVMREPNLKFEFNPDATPTVTDVSCYAVAVDISSDAESIDIATFCNPNASEVGRVTETAVVAFLWEPALITALEAHIGDEFELQLKVSPTDTKVIKFRARYASLPWGRFEVGQRVESDLTLAVIGAITYATP